MPLAMQRRRKLVPIAFALLSILYPLVAVAMVRLVGPSVAVGVLGLALVARLMVPSFDPIPLPLTIALIAVVGSMAVVAVFDRTLSVRLYPVLMSAAMLTAFGSTLVQPPSMIERFARLSEPNLPPSGVRYTRTVTWVWMAFFVLNGSIALWTALVPGWGTWTLYNGFISYVLMGLLFGGEYIIRQRVRASHP